jgi:hypothetical protein
MKYSIQNAQTELDRSDADGWRSFNVSAEGNDLVELISNAQIEEVDQEGGTTDQYPLKDATVDLQAAAISILFSAVVATEGTEA